MRTPSASAPAAALASVALALLAAADAPAASSLRPAGAQPDEAPLYQCVDGTTIDVEGVGVALCDAEPTAALHERAEPDNLQIREGALVTEIAEGGSAATEGVQPGDMIFRVAGTDVAGAAAAGEQLADVGTDSDTQINFLRGGRPYRIKLRR